MYILWYRKYITHYTTTHILIFVDFFRRREFPLHDRKKVVAEKVPLFIGQRKNLPYDVAGFHL